MIDMSLMNGVQIAPGLDRAYVDAILRAGCTSTSLD